MTTCLTNQHKFEGKHHEKYTSIPQLGYRLTHKTKLKLDKEVGGGDLAELRITITMRIVYPYA